MRPVRLALILAVGAALIGCGSPEAVRTRGGGPGADVGNRSPDVRMHEGSEPYWKTPGHIEATHPSLEPSRQAQELSRSPKRLEKGR